MPAVHNENIRARKTVAFMAAASLAIAICLAASAASPYQTAATQAPAGRILLLLDTAHSNVHFTLDTSLHTVHGEFSFKRGSIQLNPETGEVMGEIVVDATSGQSGNGSRDKRMHKEILESDRFTDVIFRPDRIDGKLTLSGSSMAQMHGTFTLHGADHDMSIPVQVEFTGDDWKGTAAFSVPYIQWGLKNPSNFLLKVNPVVNIRLEMVGTRQPTH